MKLWKWPWKETGTCISGCSKDVFLASYEYKEERNTW